MAHETFFKGPRVPQKVQNKIRHDARKKVERTLMDEVRDRDPGCRFPLCGCRRFRLNLEVAHDVHRGMGGNPAGDRTDPALMVRVCVARHRINAFALDRGTVEWRPLTGLGANGPISWHVKNEDLPEWLQAHRHKDDDGWVEVARESGPNVIVQPAPYQWAILTHLAEMTL